jgi:hypothetical protein
MCAHSIKSQKTFMISTLLTSSLKTKQPNGCFPFYASISYQNGCNCLKLLLNNEGTPGKPN